MGKKRSLDCALSSPKATVGAAAAHLDCRKPFVQTANNGRLWLGLPETLGIQHNLKREANYSTPRNR